MINSPLISVSVIEEPSSNDILVYLLIIITSVLAISLVFLFTMLCKYTKRLFPSRIVKWINQAAFKKFNSFFDKNPAQTKVKKFQKV